MSKPENLLQVYYEDQPNEVIDKVKGILKNFKLDIIELEQSDGWISYEIDEVVSDAFKWFQRGDEIVEKIMSDKNVDIRSTLEHAFDDLVDISFKEKVMMHSHMSSLFLNVQLNRLNEFKVSDNAENRAQEGRLIVAELVHKLRNE